MEIKITTNQMLKVLLILSWILFVGLSIEACGLLSTTILTFILDPVTTGKLWQQVNLSSLYTQDHGYFLAQSSFIIIVAVLKSVLFYLIVKILHDKKLDLSRPFSVETGRFISSASYLSFGIGLFSFWGGKYAQWLTYKGVKMPDVQHLQLGGADVWLFMGIILLVIAQIFKKGIEIQEENELTV